MKLSNKVNSNWRIFNYSSKYKIFLWRNNRLLTNMIGSNRNCWHSWNSISTGNNYINSLHRNIMLCKFNYNCWRIGNNKKKDYRKMIINRNKYLYYNPNSMSLLLNNSIKLSLYSNNNSNTNKLWYPLNYKIQTNCRNN
jgi:hypothetical protein